MRFCCRVRLRNLRRRSPEPYETWADVEVEAGSGILAAEAAMRQMRDKHTGWLVTCHNITMLPAEDARGFVAPPMPEGDGPVFDISPGEPTPIKIVDGPAKRGPGRPRKVA